jgi:adenosylhomocysteine nucleosidase
MLLITPSQAEYRAVEARVREYLASDSLEIVISGIGTGCAVAFGRQLGARSRPPETLALVGVAGGLDPALGVGDTVLASAALDEGGRQAPCTVISLPGAAAGPVLTVSRALYTPAEKAAARGTGALAVEMEAYPLAAWAAERGVPFVHARVILDPADETLPDLGDALDGFGRARTGPLAWSLLRHPARVVPLARLLRRMRSTSPVLGRLALAVVSASEPR